MVIACAEFLAEAREFKHAAELLKASLRNGHHPGAVVPGSPGHRPGRVPGVGRGDRAGVRVGHRPGAEELADVPARVASALNQMGEPGRGGAAVPGGREAGAERSGRVRQAPWRTPRTRRRRPATTWRRSRPAASWPATGRSTTVELHAEARKHLLESVHKLDAANKKAEAEKVQAMLTADKVRDLVIEMSWHGREADVDLRGSGADRHGLLVDPAAVRRAVGP